MSNLLNFLKITGITVLYILILGFQIGSVWGLFLIWGIFGQVLGFILAIGYFFADIFFAADEMC